MKTKITITPAHAQKAGSYLSDNCLLGTALQEKFPNLNIEVLGYSFTLNGTEIPFSDKIAFKIINCYQNSGHTMYKAEVLKPFSFTVNIPKSVLTANKKPANIKT